MNFLAVTLVLISAVIHAGWNFFIQQGRASIGFFFVACLSAALALSPFLYIYRSGFINLPPRFWLFVAGSGMFEGIYYFSLCRAYGFGDLSVTYPLVRAVPVVMVAGLSLFLGIGNRPQGLGLLGVGLVAAGCLLLPLTTFKNPRFSAYALPSSLLALAAGLGTTGYSIMDDRAMSSLAGLSAAQLPAGGITLFFLALKTLSSTTALLMLLALLPAERAALQGQRRDWIAKAALTGLFIFGAYALVLAAMAVAANVSYVVAFRQLSIPLGALLGFAVKKERTYAPRLAGIGVITAGLLLVALG